jgi:hypothetical protein
MAGHSDSACHPSYTRKHKNDIIHVGWGITQTLSHKPVQKGLRAWQMWGLELKPQYLKKNVKIYETLEKYLILPKNGRNVSFCVCWQGPEEKQNDASYYFA